MRHELTSFGLQPNALHQPFVLGLHIEEGLHVRNACNNCARLASAKRSQTVHMQLERFTFDAAEHGGDLVGELIVDVADKPQRQMIVFWIDPSRARQAATQCRQRLTHVGGDFDTGEEARHGETLLSLSHDPRAARARAINSSTRGMIRATIVSTPSAFGCRPSACLSLGSAATPSRKNG